MKHPTIKHLIYFCIFLFVQVFVLDHIPPIQQFVFPYLYFLCLLWLPININRVQLLLIAFGYGIIYDCFVGTPGLHAAPCVLIVFLRPYILNLLISKKEVRLSNIEPNPKTMGWAPYTIYITLLVLIHNAYLIFIEWMQFGDILYFVSKIFFTTLLSLVLIFITENVFSKRWQKI